MHEAGRFLVRYLVNSVWQTPLLLIAAWMASWILRRLGCIVQHRIWVAALLLAVVTPLGSVRSSAVSTQLMIDSGAANVFATREYSPVAADFAPGTIRLLPAIYWVLLFGYLVFLLLAVFRLALGLYKTSRLVKHSAAIALPSEAAETWRRCRSTFALRNPALAASSEIAGPVTVGTRRARLLLPPRFLVESSPEDFAAALSHECAHLKRQDFFLNLFYQIISLLVAYHPAAWMMKSRIAETRELICDRMAAEHMAGSQSYAHSLLRLAAAISAEPLTSSHHAIGMFDANTLENRVMHLITLQPAVSRGRKVILLTSAVLVLSLSGIAAFALTTNVEEQAANTTQATTQDQLQKSSGSDPSTSGADSTQQIYKIGGPVSAPTLVYAPDPEFSEQARQAKYQGICVVSLVVDTRGIPQRVKVVRHLEMGLDQKAIEAVKEYRFKPATLEGKPVPVKVKIEVNFRFY